MYVSALRRLSRARMHLFELRRPRRAPVSTGGGSSRTRKTAGDGVQLKRIRPRIRTDCTSGVWIRSVCVGSSGVLICGFIERKPLYETAKSVWVCAH